MINDPVCAWEWTPGGLTATDIRLAIYINEFLLRFLTAINKEPNYVVISMELFCDAKMQYSW